MPQMITRKPLEGERPWQQELAKAITDPAVLLTMLEIDQTAFADGFAARKQFPMRVPQPFIDRMVKGDPNDPLLRQVLPLSDELITSNGYVSDPLGEHDTQAPGLMHKYQSRVLLILRGGCAVNCRYCFRRHFPYGDNSPSKQEWQQSFDYIAAHPEINEVLLSGGDPLMANDQQLDWLLTQLEQIPHLRRVRIHTRLPVVIPSRITDALVSRLASSRLKALMVLHINHANEIDNALQRAAQKLKQAGIWLLNQSVLLQQVNDSADALCALSERLFEADIQPYYLHLMDKVAQAEHFDLPLARVQALNKAMMQRLPGFLVPKFVREIAGQQSKTPIDLGFNPFIEQTDLDFFQQS
ncbi:EF-P beta-lysylation protein EpmB [Corallincola holothuriorum]|uniref:L-lysine 2,3-aminomutase n=1 Tax=Corallincola holothuriorum TaxID=2282215 RepID=A0A368N157_9GAMM|nr:EF-P beta-lysylation protein EpmB [Corallincola holothuriorum]RCU43823.1 EF-P beta-lysylation protein EpmB [Corallincola holothuriorum]